MGSGTCRWTNSIDFEAFDSLEVEFEGKFTKVYKVDGLTGFIDRNTGKAVIGF